MLKILCNRVLLLCAYGGSLVAGPALSSEQPVAIPVSVALPSTSVLSGAAARGLHFPFFSGEIDDWIERAFKDRTDYRIREFDGRSVLEAHTDNSASMLFRQQPIDLKSTPFMRWTWRISDTYDTPHEASADGSGFERRKQGDDFPARVYVVHQNGLSPFDKVAINYVWSSNEAVGANWPNPFTGKARMVVVRSGASMVNQWVTETRNIVEDFREFFGIEATSLDGFAVMVDGDNSGQTTTSWFDELSFLPAQRP